MLRIEIDARKELRLNRFPILALVSSYFVLALACSDDNGSNSGQGGTQSASNGGGQNGSNAGTAGSSSMSGGSGGSSSSSSGAGGGSVGGASGMAGVSSGNQVVQDICQRGCAKTEPLNCPADPPDCEAQCLADYLNFPEQCRQLVLTFGNCGAARPNGDLLCGDDGRATVRAGVCDAEALALADCVFDAF